MKKGYWIVLYKKINNLENLKKYSEIVTPIIKNHGGVPLVRGGKHITYSGDDCPRTVVWEFPSFDKAIACHDAEEYQNGWLVAKNTTKRHLQIIEGFSTE